MPVRAALRNPGAFRTDRRASSESWALMSAEYPGRALQARKPRIHSDTDAGEGSTFGAQETESHSNRRLQ
jgi:hypothetical protein